MPEPSAENPPKYILSADRIYTLRETFLKRHYLERHLGGVNLKHYLVTLDERGAYRLYVAVRSPITQSRDLASIGMKIVIEEHDNA